MTISDEANDFLGRANIAILATVGLGNRPHAAPVWYLYEDQELLVSTGTGSQKHRNVQRNPAVTLVVERREPPYYVVTVQGEAEIGPPLSDDKRLALAIRYLGESRGQAYTERTRGSDSITLRIRPAKVIEFHGEAGRD
ncbi:MAG: PPOX class F420-dependent oxidoreductase [Chloroflexi bacterium]|nr:PPOX class F420-dependent oxidoreductase [Chloroflexota bacterium]